MKHLLFNLLTNFVFGQIVIFHDRVYRIVDYTVYIGHPFNKYDFKPSGKFPIRFFVYLKSKNDAVEVVGYCPFGKNKIQSVFDAGLSYHEIRGTY